ncbi:MAG: DUF4328 domain-containing protein [Planctomycetota bacterium]|nr:DUF4328 domain-containing protein [Planctomycetota bacterium]
MSDPNHSHPSNPYQVPPQTLSQAPAAPFQGSPPPPQSPLVIAPFQPIAGLGKAAMILLVLGALVDLLSLGSSAMQWALLNQIKNGGEITEAAAQANDVREMLIGLVTLLVYLVTAIVFLVWFHRAYKNLPALGGRNLATTPGWATGSFFIPILNLFRPYQAVAEIWKTVAPPGRPQTIVIGSW